jgi:hypothetical protein
LFHPRFITNAFGTELSPQDTGKLAEKANKKPPGAGSGKEGGTLPPPGGFNGAIHVLFITHEKRLCKGPGKINFPPAHRAAGYGFITSTFILCNIYKNGIE